VQNKTSDPMVKVSQELRDETDELSGLSPAEVVVYEQQLCNQLREAYDSSRDMVERDGYVYELDERATSILLSLGVTGGYLRDTSYDSCNEHAQKALAKCREATRAGGAEEREIKLMQIHSALGKLYTADPARQL